MRALAPKAILAALALAALLVAPFPTTATTTDAPQQPRRAAPDPFAGVLKASVNPNWFANNTKFWYRNDLANQTKEFILVSIDADSATRARAFDHAKLAAALAKAADMQVDPNKLPFDAIALTPDLKTLTFTIKDSANGTAWKCDLATYQVTKSTGPGAMLPIDPPAAGGPAAAMLQNDAPALADAADPDTIDPMLASPQIGRPGRPVAGLAREAPQMPVPQPLQSPDRQLTAVVHDNNVFFRAADGTETQITKDGTATDAYTRLIWSQDSKALIAYRQQLGDHLSVYHILSSPQPAQGGSRGGVGREVLSEQAYDLPGDKLDSYEMNIFNVATGKLTKPDTGRWDMQEDGEAPAPQDLAPHWMDDGIHFLIEKVDRGHQRLRVFNINVQTGETKAVIDEQTKTFIWTANRDGQTFPVVNMLRLRPNNRNDQTVSNEIIYASEKSGYRHLYLVNATTGETKPIDHGDWVLRNIDFVDQQNREIWFMASGVYADQDPYLIQYGHIKFDGSEQVFMTGGNGNHHVVDIPAANTNEHTSYSSDNKYIVDTYTRVDLAPVTELRRVSDGKLMVELEKAEPPATWTPPEVFVSKARDDKTDIWGIIVRPANFDPTKKYPIIEDIYAGPHGSFVPKTFNVAASYRALTNLGFIVVKMDGMGTANRSKAFQDVCWQNLADAGFPDRIKWIKAAAAKYPYMDIDRVGIYGTSAGGQAACGAVLFHPEFYKVAVANSGCHDNRMDKITWNEEWMGYPVGPQYAACSNIDNAYRLQGHLQLVLGEQDNNVPPESTFRLVDALNRANKDFEFVFIPGADHGAGIQGENVVQNKLQDFFVRYLQHQDPPERNSQPARAGRGG